jgi:Putative lumazine-binding
MRSITIAACLLILIPRLWSQSKADNQAAADVVKSLFRGMQLGDSAMVHSAFTNGATMATIYRDNQNNPVLVREPSINNFLKAVGTPHPDPWNEEIWDIKVSLDGDFAQVWCSYAFYSGNRFSHCGVDAFHLFRGKNGWKIFHLADTRSKDNCTVPAEIRRKYQP